jgi:acetyl esterase/lipase
MLWYRRMYMANDDDWKNWDASPNFAPDDLLKQLPPTWMAISEQDLLAPEAIKFGKQLTNLGVPVTVYEVEGGTHSIMTLSGVVSKGKELLDEAAHVLKTSFKPLHRHSSAE